MKTFSTIVIIITIITVKISLQFEKKFYRDFLLACLRLLPFGYSAILERDIVYLTIFLGVEFRETLSHSRSLHRRLKLLTEFHTRSFSGSG